MSNCLGLDVDSAWTYFHIFFLFGSCLLWFCMPESHHVFNHRFILLCYFSLRTKVPFFAVWWRHTDRERNKGPKCQTLVKDQMKPKSKYGLYIIKLDILFRARLVSFLYYSPQFQRKSDFFTCVCCMVFNNQALLERTGYTLDVTTGQRKYGGPPPESVHSGAQPTIGTEVKTISFTIILRFETSVWWHS